MSGVQERDSSSDQPSAVYLSPPAVNNLKHLQKRYRFDTESATIEYLLAKAARRSSLLCCRAIHFLYLYRLVLFATALLFVPQFYYLFYFPTFFLNSDFDENSSRVLFFADPQIEGDARIARQGFMGRVHIMFNDCFMRWVSFRTNALIKPSMVVYLGDMVSSQEISFLEFQRRASRLRWIFADIPSDIKSVWLSGNHDIGYGSDCNFRRLSRFENAFGPSDQYFEYLGHRWLSFNSQLVEGVRDPDLQNITNAFIEKHGNEHFESSGTENYRPMILLDHIPLYKPQGCADPPMIRRDRDGYILTQTMLSQEFSDYIMNLTRPVLIFNGHDHNGCNTRHQLSTGETVEEYTIRSMMGEFGGFSAVLEIVNADGGFDYTISWIPFWTTNGVLLRFVLLLVWTGFFLLHVVCCCGCRPRRSRPSLAIDKQTKQKAE